MNTYDWVALLTLALVLIDTVMWIATQIALRRLVRVVSPLVTRGMELLGAVPAGVFGRQTVGAVKTPPMSAPGYITPQVKVAKNGNRYFIDPVTGISRFLRKGESPPTLATTVSTAENSAENGVEEVDLNALARAHGYEPKQVSELVERYASLIPNGRGGAMAPPNHPHPPATAGGTRGAERPPAADPTDEMVSAAISAVMSGEASVGEVLKTIGPALAPRLIAELRKGANGGGGGAGTSAPAGTDFW
jgi:hypothetical protein